MQGGYLVGEILIATSGFSYSDWRGDFYPQTLRREEFLSYYAAVFPFTELNFTYYRQPQAAALAAMAERTPPSFRFSVKLHQSLTHEIGDRWEEDAELFLRGVEPLAERDRLAGLLAQFPFSFHYTGENRTYLDRLARRYEGLPLFVEFRNREWQRESVFEEMDRRGLHHVIVDEPALEGLPETVLRVTGDRAYVRFHGRNHANWWSGDAVSRYDYRYSADELKEWLPKLKGIERQTRLLLVAFNNHYKGKAAGNALQLKELLAAEA